MQIYLNTFTNQQKTIQTPKNLHKPQKFPLAHKSCHLVFAFFVNCAAFCKMRLSTIESVSYASVANQENEVSQLVDNSKGQLEHLLKTFCANDQLK
jgi:hypothetical protein